MTTSPFPRLRPLRDFARLAAALLFAALALTTTRAPLSLASSAAGARPAAAQTGGGARRGALVFVVSGSDESSDMTLDALVRVERGRFVLPYPDQQTDAAQAFAAEYYRPGRKYRLTFGGGDAGSVTIKGSGEGCNNVHANATGETSAPIRGRVMGLATDSDTIGRRPSARRAPDAAERAAALELVRKIYRQRRTPASLLKSIEVTNLAATDLDGDGRFELVGSFTVEQRGRRRDLFLIAAPSAKGVRADFVNFSSYRVPAEGFDSALDFVDQLDMDGDGVSEVVALQHGFDAYGYTVFKKRRGRWVEVHSATGDAC